MEDFIKKIMSTHLIHRGLAKKIKEKPLNLLNIHLKYGIETIYITKDNQLVCFHDFNLRRIFNLNKKVKDINYSEAKENKQ